MEDLILSPQFGVHCTSASEKSHKMENINQYQNMAATYITEMGTSWSWSKINNKDNVYSHNNRQHGYCSKIWK